jgi:hypothetical protein
MVLEVDFTDNPLLAVRYFNYDRLFDSSMLAVESIPLKYLSERSKQDVRARIVRPTEAERIEIAGKLGLAVGDVHDFYRNISGEDSDIIKERYDVRNIFYDGASSPVNDVLYPSSRVSRNTIEDGRWTMDETGSSPVAQRKINELWQLLPNEKGRFVFPYAGARSPSDESKHFSNM